MQEEEKGARKLVVANTVIWWAVESNLRREQRENMLGVVDGSLGWA